MQKLEFNIAGPCFPGKHYMLDPLRGIGEDLFNLIDGEKYFIIHAARQTGKTTLLKELVRQINTQGRYFAMYCSLEAIQGIIDPKEGIPAIVRKIGNYIENQGITEGFGKNANFEDSSGVLNTSLVSFCRSLDKPLVLFFDEADCLSNGTLISFLRQLREGYINRTDAPFVHSIALVGMRNIRDFKARIRPESESLGGASPFNIMTESLNLRNFYAEEVAGLYGQHTTETGQVFEPQAVEYIFEQTQGQPWLVNAIARNAVEKITKKDYSIPVTLELAKQAIQNIILEWGTHFDSMMERLKETRVRNVILPLITGGEIIDEHTEDYRFTKDLGIIREINGKTVPANPIYAELIIRSLNWNVQKSIRNTHKEYECPRYIKNGELDMNFLLKDFQSYWRENSEIWKDRYKNNFYEYDEAAPHLVLQAFLQRVVNGGGYVIREMALGTRQADLCVIYEEHKYPIELKILQNQRSFSDSLTQTLGYMDKVGSNNGWLVIFDRTTEKSWDEKIYMKEEIVDGKKITVVGC